MKPLLWETVYLVAWMVAGSGWVLMLAAALGHWMGGMV